MSTAQEIITKFELQCNDITELSSAEELALLNKIYIQICSDRPYEFLKTVATGSISVDSSGVYYITLPSDFSSFAINRNYTNNSISNDYDQENKVIFIGTNYQPYQVVNFSDRRQYRNNNGYAYLDLANSKIVFTYAPQGTTYEFDYIKVPATLGLSDSPIFPARFHPAIQYIMATENDVLQISPKAKSYAAENLALGNKVILDMQYWNSTLLNN